VADPDDIKIFRAFSNAQLVSANFRHYSIAEQTLFPRLLNQYNLNLMHFTNFNAPIFYKKPFVVTIHDVVHHQLPGAKKSHVLHRLAYKLVINKAIQNSRAIITVSEASKKDISNLLGVTPEKIKVIYEGSFLPTQANPEHAADLKNKFFISNPYFLFVGTLERKKNIIGLARGFAQLLKRTGLKMDLVFAGHADPHYPDIRLQALAAGNKEHMVFTDWVSDRDLAALYYGAFAFVSASGYEGFGLPGVEAMKFSLPLLVSNTPVFNEIYDNAAIYFDWTNPNDIAKNMELIAKDNQFYKQLQENSRKRSLLFDWQKTAKITLECYEKAINLPPESV
jgi:glycosyltransferase involved in cell wall biosynthesis